MRRTLAGVSAALTIALSAAPLSAQQVLIINGASNTSEPSTTSSITTQLTTLHTAVGNNVTVANGRPSDLSSYAQVWDIRFSDSGALTGDDQSAYLAYLQGGGGMFIMGENESFTDRNNSLFSFIGLAGGGSVAFGSGSSSQTVCGPFNGPNAVGTIGYSAPGWFSSRGTGDWITASDCSGASGGSGIAWAKGTLANATGGALTTILDVNFMQTNAVESNRLLTANLVNYVGQQVVSTVPEPSTVALSATGLLALGAIARRRRAA
ncbi:MAG: PEP-CTERM sorting domain-containing protein [Gemmatirosa sp.]